MKKGRVYWLTGLSNVGKTTIGNVLYYDLKKKNENVIILDGDIMKDITTVSTSEEYSREGRLIRAKRYSAVSKLLSDQGMNVIVCTISMYDEIRQWNRDNIKGYIEVFIDAPQEILKSRDKKGLYRIESDIEYPKYPDIKVINDGRLSIRSIVDSIKNFVPKNEEDFDRDRIYWNQYYTDIKDGLAEPSQFAKDIAPQLEKGRHLLELGCGNGRDSLFFLKQGLRVTALDASDIAVDYLNKMTASNDAALFVCDNFVKCQSLYQMKYDYIYSRFTLHAISEEQEDELLANVRNALSNEGKLFIEARTTKDEIYGKGRQVGQNAFIYDNHFRRFIDVEKFQSKLEIMRFQIESIEEKQGFSKTENSDPVLMRCIAKIN